jgi:undecaprenyl-diphosphatase
MKHLINANHLTTLLLFTCLVLLYLAINHEPLFALDSFLTLGIYNAVNSDLFTFFMIVITNYTIGTIWGAALVSAIILAKRKAKYFLYFAVSTGCVFASIYILKIMISRQRPFEISEAIKYLSDNIPIENSFPSGHNTLAFFIAYFAINFFKLKPRFAATLYLLATSVAFSRVYLGAHFVSDVLAGMCLGLLWGRLSVMGLSRLKI